MLTTAKQGGLRNIIRGGRQELKYIAALCEEEGINYSMFFGSLIGTVRRNASPE